MYAITYIAATLANAPPQPTPMFHHSDPNKQKHNKIPHPQVLCSVSPSCFSLCQSIYSCRRDSSHVHISCLFSSPRVLTECQLMKVIKSPSPGLRVTRRYTLLKLPEEDSWRILFPIIKMFCVLFDVKAEYTSLN